MKKPLILATGVILGAALSIGGIAFADSSINVSFNPLKIFVNSVDKTPANNQFNNNGSVVPAELIYSGTTYVPLRMASNLLGTPITYDGANHAIRLGADQSQGTYLSDTNPYSVSGDTAAESNNDPKSIVGTYWYFSSDFQMTMASIEYAKGVSMKNIGSLYDDGKTSKAFYNLNGKYHSLSALIGFDDQSGPDFEKTVSIFADDKNIWSHDFKTGDLPQTINLPVTDVLQLRVEVKDTNDSTAYLDIVNPVLK